MKLSQSEIEARLAEVRRSYIASLEQKRDAIEMHWSALCIQWHADTYQSLYLIIHSLAGSAETFGLADVSHSARKLVEQFKRKKEQHAFTGHQITTMTEDIQHLLTSMTAGLSELIE